MRAVWDGRRSGVVVMQALGERIRPVLTVNKLDRCFLELMLGGEEAYQGFRCAPGD